jgi:hypothetical protein
LDHYPRFQFGGKGCKIGRFDQPVITLGSPTCGFPTPPLYVLSRFSLEQAVLLRSLRNQLRLFPVPRTIAFLRMNCTRSGQSSASEKIVRCGAMVLRSLGQIKYSELPIGTSCNLTPRTRHTAMLLLGTHAALERRLRHNERWFAKMTQGPIGGLMDCAPI